MSVSIGRITALITMAFALFASPLYAAKFAEPGKDHPLVGRYEGSVMTFHQKPKFDEISLLKAPVNPSDENNPKVLQLEGNVSFYYYEWSGDRSGLEVHRNFESSFKAKGLEILFSCTTSNGSCYTDKTEKHGIYFGVALGEATNWPNILIRNDCGYADDTSARYTLAKRETGNGVTHVGMAVCENPGDTPGYVYVAVVESKAMDTGKIAFLDASAMQKSLNATGRVNLYGIYFDTDKDTVKPESKPTLDEIAKLLRDNPKLRLEVVGHTDSTGNAAHNKDLSNRRAASVIRALTQAGIDDKRFTSRGAGASEPVAGNDNEAGRARNRRVELVKQ